MSVDLMRLTASRYVRIFTPNIMLRWKAKKWFIPVFAPIRNYCWRVSVCWLVACRPRYSGTCRHLTAEEVAARIADGKRPAWRFIVPDNEAVDFIDTVKGPAAL